MIVTKGDNVHKTGWIQSVMNTSLWEEVVLGTLKEAVAWSLQGGDPRPVGVLTTTA